jgi:two-component system phosphate regulon response regulator PhoB
MTTGQSILVVEDENDLADLICFNLQGEGYRCRHAGDGDQALREVDRERPDLIVLDRMLPRKPGEEVAAELKRKPQTSSIPIIMLTAKADESDELVGFALGADDYITKPFSMKLLIARVAAILRRSEAADDDARILTTGPISLDPDRHEVTVDGKSVNLTATEFRLVRTLMVANGRVLDRSRLIDAVLGTGVAVTDRTIDVHVAALRKKLDDAANWIQTIRGVGYTFRAPT